MFYGDGKNYAPGFGPKKPMDHQLGKRPEFTYDAPRPEFVTDVGQVGRERQTVAEIAGGYGRAGSPANIAGAPAMAPKKRGDTFNDNGQTLYYDDKSSTYLGKSAYDRLYNPQPAKPAGLMAPKTTQALTETAANNLGESPFTGLKVDWQRVEGNQRANLLRETGEQRAAAERAARVSGAQRGLMTGDSGIMAGQMARIGENAAMMNQRGNLDIAANIDNQSRDYDMRLAGAEAGWRQGMPSALAAALMIPGSLYGQEQANKGAMLGNQYNERTMDSRVGQQQEAYTGGLLNNQGAEIANGITREQGAVMKDTLERLRRKEEAGLALSELELKQKKWADDNAWWLGPLMFGGEVVKSAASGAAKAMAGG